MKIAKYFGALVLAGTLTACGDDFLDPQYSSSVDADQMKEAAASDPDKVLGAQISGVYANWSFSSPISTGNIMDHMTVGWPGIMMLSDAMSNDVAFDMNGDPWKFDHQLDYYAQEYVRSSQPWNFFYTLIKGSNEIISQIDSTTTNEAVRAYLGQAYAFRGISYMYLPQFYQHPYSQFTKDMPAVPLVLTAAEADKATEGRATVEQVYAVAESDLLKAKNFLKNFARTSKSQIDLSVVNGMLSRLYLVKREWKKAADAAYEARQGSTLMDMETALNSDYQDVLNPEVIWGVDITTSTCMIYASYQSWMSAQSVGYGGQVGAVRKIDQKLYDQIPASDVRKYLYYDKETAYEGGWTLPALANQKFKYVADFMGDYVYMRTSEMYLTEAEALFMNGETDKAGQVLGEFMANRQADWNGLVTRAAIRLQRRIELWGEGFSYFDHRRWQMDMDRGYDGTNAHSSTWPMHGPNGTTPWYHYAWRYQLPLKEIQENEAIGEENQNPVGEDGNQDLSWKLD
jgi:hypothetical protein